MTKSHCHTVFVVYVLIEATNGPEWTSILHKGDTNTQREPGVWLTPSSTSLAVTVSTVNNWSVRCPAYANLALNG